MHLLVLCVAPLLLPLPTAQSLQAPNPSPKEPASSQLQIVGIIVLHILAHPQHDTAEHDQPISQDICDAHVDGLHGVILEQVLQRHDGGTASEATGHEGETEEEHGTGLPCNSVSTIREAVGGEAGFLDAVDHQHAQRGAD